MRLRGLLRDLAGRADASLVEAMVGQIDAADRALRLLCEQVGDGTRQGLAEELERIEHEGDAHRMRLSEELSRTLTTPIDREDLFRVSRSIDDVLDNLRDFSRELELYAPADPRCCLPLFEAALDGVAALREAVEALPNDRQAALTASRKTKKLGGNELRRRYEEALARLFEGELTMDVIKTREVLRRLDVVALRLGEAADALDDGLVKRM